jgi:MarR family transcriptional regulator, 2-MHQ and catechol-resistance regulon repressor
MAASEQGTEQTPRFSSPQEEALLNILRSADCLHRAFQQRLKPYGLTATQYNVLRILRRAHPKGLTCSAIGRMMITPEPDITRLLARLKAQKLVGQRRDKHDGRVVWTHLSGEGMEAVSKLDGLIDQAPKELLRGLNCEEVSELIRLLGKARCCGGDEVPVAEQAFPSGKSHLPPSRPLRHHPE